MPAPSAQSEAAPLATPPTPIWVAGVDEVGRGALFGPVVAAAVILTPAAAQSLQAAGVQDSKRLRPHQRETLAIAIRAQALSVGLGYVSAPHIDRINILQGSLLAMARAIARLHPQPDLCLVDGNQTIPHLPMAQRTVVQGDQREVAIAAASIVAKVWRDALIVRLDRHYPGYDLAANKGYGSQRHRDGLARLGPTRQHRRSFRTCQQQLPLF